jgi:quercetin dioxygenase-like cupin family protein
MLPSGSVQEHPQLHLSLSVRKLADDIESQPPLVRGKYFERRWPPHNSRIGGTKSTRLTDTEAVMFGKRATLVGLATVALLVSVVAVASADPGSGFTSVVIGRGQTDQSFNIHQRKANDVVTAQNTLAPGGFSGWHSHPGTVVLVVQSGEFTLFSEPVKGGKCTVRTYSAGQVYLEQPGDEENAVNKGTLPAVLAVTFFNVPHGGSNRIERTDPGNCPG